MTQGAAERIADVSPARLASMKAWCEQRIAEKPWFKDQIRFPGKPEMCISCDFMIALIDLAASARADALEDAAKTVEECFSEATDSNVVKLGEHVTAAIRLLKDTGT